MPLVKFQLPFMYLPLLYQCETSHGENPNYQNQPNQQQHDLFLVLHMIFFIDTRVHLLITKWFWVGQPVLQTNTYVH